MLIVGQKTLGLPFQAQLVIDEVGLSHNNITVPWKEIDRVKITYFIEARKKFPWSYVLFLKYIHWAKMTIETKQWRLVLDSRVLVKPNDEMKLALGNFTDKVDDENRNCITPAFNEVKKILEGSYPEKIVERKAFAGSFDFSEKASWIGAILVLLLIGFISAVIYNALRPLFK